MKKLTLKTPSMKGELLTRKQLKNVLGGQGSEGNQGDICRFKYKYTADGSGDWSNFSDYIAVPGGGNAACLMFIGQQGITRCAYDCISS